MIIHAIFPLLVLSQLPVVERSYDKFRDITTTRIEVGRVGKSNENISMVLYRFSKRDQVVPISDHELVDITFFSRSTTFKFLKIRDMHILADAKRFSASRADHDSDIYNTGVSEVVSGTIKFEDLEKIASSTSVEIAVGIVEFSLSKEQIEILRLYVAELKFDQAALEAMAKEKAEQAKILDQLKAEEERRKEELEKKAKAELDEKVDRIFPIARKALIDAKNRGAGAPISIRKAQISKYENAAQTKICDMFHITRKEFEQIIAIGREREAAAKKKK